MAQIFRALPEISVPRGQTVGMSILKDLREEIINPFSLAYQHHGNF